jgi:hypothetical protein
VSCCAELAPTNTAAAAPECRLLFYIDNTSQQATENFTIVPPADKQADKKQQCQLICSSNMIR